MGTLTQQMQSLAMDITRSRDERLAWLGALRAEVNGLRTQMRAHGRERRAWVKSLQDDVRHLRRDLRSDLRGARGAWQEAITAGARAGAETAPAKRARPTSKHRK